MDIQLVSEFAGLLVAILRLFGADSPFWENFMDGRGGDLIFSQVSGAVFYFFGPPVETKKNPSLPKERLWQCIQKVVGFGNVFRIFSIRKDEWLVWANVCVFFVCQSQRSVFFLSLQSRNMCFNVGMNGWDSSRWWFQSARSKNTLS